MAPPQLDRYWSNNPLITTIIIMSPARDPDGELARELREIEASRAKFVEPSATERVRKPVTAVRRRESRKARKLREPVRPASAGSAPRARGARRGRLRRTGAAGDRKPRRLASQPRTVIGLALIAALLAAGIATSVVIGQRTKTGSPGRPGLRAVPAFTAADPFARTPAAGYANGTSGILVPRARPVGGYSAAQVQAAYGMTRQLLIAADLNAATLHGGLPDAFARLLAPQLRKYFLRQLGKTGRTRSGYVRSTRSWVASFAPGTQFVGTVVKVHGYMAATTARDSGRTVLRIHADYIFVYPVQRAGQPLTRMRIVNLEDVDVDFAQWDDPGGRLEPWWLPRAASGPSGARCDTSDGFIHPQYPESAPAEVRPSGAPMNPYNLNPPANAAACRATAAT